MTKNRPMSPKHETMKHDAPRIRHQFTDRFPPELEPGVLYVSMEFRTTTHLCPCDCGNVVTLPLRPTAWRIAYDGETIAMSPSVGNWSFPCRSHYWIRNSEIHWAADWTDDQVDAERRRTLIERGASDKPPWNDGTAESPGWLRRSFQGGAERGLTARPDPSVSTGDL